MPYVKISPKNSHLYPTTWVTVSAPAGDLEGLIVAGDFDPVVGWDLDSTFNVKTEEGELFSVNGWCCDVEISDVRKEPSKRLSPT